MAPTKKMRLAHQKKEKSAVRDSNHLLSCCTSRAAINLLPHYVVYINRDCYVPIRTSRRLDFFLTQKSESRTRRRDDASTAEAAPGRVGRDEQDEGMSSKHRAEWWTSSRVRAFTAQPWSKSDFPIAETTRPTYLYTYLYLSLIHI